MEKVQQRSKRTAQKHAAEISTPQSFSIRRTEKQMVPQYPHNPVERIAGRSRRTSGKESLELPTHQQTQDAHLQPHRLATLLQQRTQQPPQSLQINR
jgi:hypothetical protein